MCQALTRKHLTSNAIKIIAIAAMTVDHSVWTIWPGYSRDILPIVLHLIGRITAPIMCYFIAEGYHYTRNVDKYTKRLFLFALISHFPYLLASIHFVNWRSFIPFYYGDVLNQTSVMWSLAWGLVMLRINDSAKIKRNSVKALLILLACLVSFPSDWSCIASLCVLAFGTNRGKFKTQMLWMFLYVAMYATVYALALDPVYGLLQMGVVLAIPILACYNGQRGHSKRVNDMMKWFFYAYYPIHLLILGCMRYVF
jgi:hypothetical protein